MGSYGQLLATQLRCSEYRNVWLLAVMRSYGQLWLLWAVMGLWTIMGCCGQLWGAMDKTLSWGHRNVWLWAVISSYGQQWAAMGCYGQLWSKPFRGHGHRNFWLRAIMNSFGWLWAVTGRNFEKKTEEIYRISSFICRSHPLWVEYGEVRVSNKLILTGMKEKGHLSFSFVVGRVWRISSWSPYPCPIGRRIFILL